MNNNSQMNPSASTDSADFYSFHSLVSQDFINEIRQIGITGVQRTVEQVPAPDNGHTAICSVEVDTSRGKFSDFGVATPNIIGGSTDTGELLGEAANQGTRKALGMALVTHQVQPVLDITPAPLKQLPSNGQQTQQNLNRRSSNGGGSKPASEKQVSWIQSLCLKGFVAPEAMAQKICGKPMAALTGSDANKMIQSLQQAQTI